LNIEKPYMNDLHLDLKDPNNIQHQIPITLFNLRPSYNGGQAAVARLLNIRLGNFRQLPIADLLSTLEISSSPNLMLYESNASLLIILIISLQAAFLMCLRLPIHARVKLSHKTHVTTQATTKTSGSTLRELGGCVKTINAQIFIPDLFQQFAIFYENLY